VTSVLAVAVPANHWSNVAHFLRVRPEVWTRIGLGLVTLAYYLVHYRDRRFLFGPDGVWPWSNFEETLGESGSFSLYALSRSDLWFELVFHVGIVISLLVVVGFRTRVIVPIHYVLIWSIFQRNPSLLDGGDNLLYLVLLYLIAVDCSAHFSLDARSAAARGGPSRPPVPGGFASPPRRGGRHCRAGVRALPDVGPL
jgi:hypothetical protein